MRLLLHDLLEDAAGDHPGRPAVIDRDRSLSYGALDALANRIGNLLVREGVVRGDRVGLYLDKSLEAVACAYGIMKAGGAYVPLDPDAPVARLAQIAGDCGLRCLMTGAEKSESWGALVAAAASIELLVVVNADQVDADFVGVTTLTRRDIEGSPAEPVPVTVIDQDLAYILYTSGSTGTPKGVMLTHRAAMAFVTWAAEEFTVGPDDRLSSHAPFHFDLSVFDLYAAAHAAAAVVLVPAKASIFPKQVAAFIRDNGITVWYSVPSALTMLTLRGGLAAEPLPSLRVVLFAGEVFPTKYLRELMRLVPQARFANLYGPTETNVCTWYEVRHLADDATEPVPIGVAIANDEVFVLNEDGGETGVGEIGELLVRGATVMRGYWGDDERSARSLVADPRGRAPTDPVYRTGDLVSILPDGSFRLVGRKDAQVKSRGYRIELGDVEAALNAHPDVVECAVVAVPDEVFTNRLLAYVAAPAGVTDADLVAFCAERIPGYMIPEAITILAILPKTSTGKIDRRTLLDQAVMSSA